MDGTAKGGVVLGISHQFKIPVKYIGIGEKIADLKLFDPKTFVESFFKWHSNISLWKFLNNEGFPCFV